MRTNWLLAFVASVAVGLVGCSEGETLTPPSDGSGGFNSMPTGGSGPNQNVGGNSTAPVGGSSANTAGGFQSTGGAATGGKAATGGGEPTGGRAATGGVAPTGGRAATGGVAPTGGRAAAGGAAPTGGKAATGGVAPTGGKAATGGNAAGGAATGGQAAVGGAVSTGGKAATGGAGTAGSTGTIDCSAPMPTSGATTHCGSYRTGKAGSLSWELWSNSYSSNACITYYTVPAFSAKWNNNGDFLARLGIEWGGKSIASLGTITAEYTFKKSGTGGGFSYIGVYGWATSPCVEYYIIDDSFNGMPFSPWNMQNKGSATIDGEVYKFYSGSTGGTGGSRCAGGGTFTQYWSIRQKGRQCGVMTITKHFEEWKKVGMSMDNILEAKILAETGGGSGTVDFPIASVKASL